MFIFILLNLAVGLPFTREIAQQIFTQGQSALFIFYDGSHQHTKSTKEALDAFSELSIDITLIEADVQLESVSRLMSGLNLDRCIHTQYVVLLPSVRLLEMHGANVGDIHKYSYDEQITSIKLTKFIERYVDGELLPDFKSEDIPTKQFEDGIAVVVGHNYDQFTLDSTRHALIFLYSKTCEHCTSMLPNLISLNKVIRSGKTPINPSTFKIGKMDVTLNDGVVVTMLPTLHLHTINGKEHAIEYSGDRTAEGMLKWLENTIKSGVVISFIKLIYMQSLIKQALALTEASEAAKWSEVESALKPAQLDSKSLAEVAIHFANNQKGSQAFWDELQSVSANKLDSFNREDLAILSRAMILHPYEVDDSVGEQISAGMDYFCQEEIDRQKRQDPYFLAKVVSIIQSGLGPYAFRAGPGFFGGAVVDDVNNEEELESDDEDLSAHQVSHVKSTLIDLKSNTASKSLVQEDILEQAKKMLEEVFSVVILE